MNNVIKFLAATASVLLLSSTAQAATAESDGQLLALAEHCGSPNFYKRYRATTVENAVSQKTATEDQIQRYFLLARSDAAATSKAECQALLPDLIKLRQSKEKNMKMASEIAKKIK